MVLFMYVSDFAVGCWYMTFDYQNLYQIEKYKDHYRVIRFGDWMPVFSGPMEAVALFMASNCPTHGKYERSVGNGK